MTTAADIINLAAVVLQDVSNVRWPRDELVDWVSEGQRVIATLSPEAYTVVEIVQPGVGTKQTLPSGGIRLVSVVRNIYAGSGAPTGSSRAVRLVDRAVLDAQYPDWHVAASGYTQNYVFDKRNPKVYYIYPPHSGSTTQRLEIIYTKLPSTFTTEATALVVDEQYHTALVDYVLYRAYLKDAEYTQNAERAQLHYQAFAAVVSGKEAIDATVEPTPAGSTRPGIGAPV